MPPLSPCRPSDSRNGFASLCLCLLIFVSSDQGGRDGGGLRSLPDPGMAPSQALSTVVSHASLTWKVLSVSEISTTEAWRVVFEGSRFHGWWAAGLGLEPGFQDLGCFYRAVIHERL